MCLYNFFDKYKPSPIPTLLYFSECETYFLNSLDITSDSMYGPAFFTLTSILDSVAFSNTSTVLPENA